MAKKNTQQKRADRRAGERGAALILAIFTCVVLTVLAVGLTQVVRVEIIASRSSLDRLQASYLAKAGFNLGRSLLIFGDEQDVDSIADSWYKLQDQAPIQLGEGWYKTVIVDACSMINVNEANEEILTNIFGDPNIAAAIVTWHTDHGDFHSLGELTQIDGVDKAKVGELAHLLTVESRERNVPAKPPKRDDSTESQAQQRRANLNVQGVAMQNGAWMIPAGLNPGDSNDLAIANKIDAYRRPDKSREFKSLGELFDAGLNKDQVKRIIDYVALSDDDYQVGRVNLNTAPREVLLALPEMKPQIADAIIAKRQEENGAFKSVGELLDMTEVTQEIFGKLADHICTKSSTYIIESYAELNDKPVRRTVQGMVLRQPGPMAPLYYGWREVSRPTFIDTQDINSQEAAK